MGLLFQGFGSKGSGDTERRSMTSSKPWLLLPVKLSLNQVTRSLQALLDSEGEQNIIDTELANQLHLSLIPLNPPVPVTALNNQVFGVIMHP